MTAVTLPRRSTEAEPVVVEIEHVPTLAELAKMSTPERMLCRVVQRNTKGEPTIFAPTAEGHALLGEIMRRNGRALAAAEAARSGIRTQPLLSARQAAMQWAREAFGEP
ncbi:helix-turn-helix DNA binding domain protein [Microbacterium phage Pickles13]|nr:helix-turn-helix DNA binding domain protein [Microbacterium phage Pickles13]